MDAKRERLSEAQMRKPLNGEKTHPLSAHAIAELMDIARAPVPTCSINPGVLNRLGREDLIEIVALPSPFKTHKGRATTHAQITPAGRRALEKEG